MSEIRLVSSERIKPKLTAAQERAIKKLYKDSLRNIRDWAKFLEGKSNVSSILRTQYLNNMEREIQQELHNIGSQVEDIIEANMTMVSQAVVEDINSVLNGLGLHIKGAYSFVPASVVQAITTGQVYDGNWSLSKAVWQHTRKSQQDIQDIIAKGVLENKSSYEIAKELEKYVDPRARKPWDWGKIYPGTNKVIDYNAQRLARTLVSHAYQQSFMRTTRENPFFEGYRWLTANNHRVCEVCRSYAENQHAEGLPEGVFPKSELPLDHPNGQCTMTIYTTQTTDDIVDSLVNWVHGESNPQLDRFARDLGYPIRVVKSFVKP